MKTYLGTLSETSLKALSEFLRRTTLKGDEVPAFNKALNELSQSQWEDLEASSRVR